MNTEQTYKSLARSYGTAFRYYLCSFAAIACGVGSWAIISRWTGIEAWDHQAYWLIGYPFMVVVAAILGWFCPKKPWIWGLVIILAQMVYFIATSWGQALILPLTIIIFLILGIPLMIVANVSAKQTTAEKQ